MTLKMIFRRFLGKCILCGQKKQKHEDCAHCAFSDRLCHWCGKRWSFASNYGMSKNRIVEILSK